MGTFASGVNTHTSTVLFFRIHSSWSRCVCVYWINKVLPKTTDKSIEAYRTFGEFSVSLFFLEVFVTKTIRFKRAINLCFIDFLNFKAAQVFAAWIHNVNIKGVNIDLLTLEIECWHFGLVWAKLPPDDFIRAKYLRLWIRGVYDHKAIANDNAINMSGHVKTSMTSSRK